MATFGLKLYNTADFALTSANGIYVKSVSDDIPSKTYPVQIPRRHGGKVDDYPKLGPRVINMTGLIQGSTKEIYRTNVETFAKNLKYGKQKFYKFDDRYIWVNNSSLSIRDGPTMLWGDFSAELICTDPFWYALAESEIHFTTALTSYSFTPTTIGNAPTPPWMTFSTVDTYANVENSTVFQSFRYTHTIASVIINASDFTATEGGNNGLAYFTGDFWLLNTGVNNCVFTQPNTTSVTVYCYWTDRWY